MNWRKWRALGQYFIAGFVFTVVATIGLLLAPGARDTTLFAVVVIGVGITITTLIVVRLDRRFPEDEDAR